jgi:hypothetical protein
MSFYFNSLRLRHSVCEQPMKKSLSTFEDCMKNVHSISLKTDRATEQMNQNVELYICMFSNYSQNNWASLLLMTELVINNHDFVSTEWASFLSHEYHMKPLQLLEKLKPVQSAKSSVQKADQIVQKMKEVTEWAQMTMTVTQQIQKEMMNWKRQQSYDFKKEDKIWLNLKNIHTDCLCKKFDAKNVKYIIVKKISSHSFCLNTLSGIHNVFHSVMLQSAVMNALSSQCMTDSQSSSQIVSDEEEFEIKKILKKRFVWCKEEFKKKYLMKWVSYTNSHENQSVLKDTVMLNQWKLMQPEVAKS